MPNNCIIIIGSFDHGFQNPCFRKKLRLYLSLEYEKIVNAKKEKKKKAVFSSCIPVDFQIE